MAPGKEATSWGRTPDHPIDGLDDVGVRLSKNHHHDCRFSVDETKVPEVLDRVLHGAHVGEPNGRAGVVAHDDRLILFCAVELIVCVDLPILIRVGDLPFGTHRRGRPENAADILEADAVFVQCRRVKLDPDRRKGSAAHKHLTDAVYLGELLPHDARRRVIELCDRERIRLEGNDENRRVRGIPFPIPGRGREVGRQEAFGRIDGRLHVPGRPVDVAVQVELEDDGRGAPVARRRHFRDAGDATELPLQGRRHRGGHGLRVGAGKRSGHVDGRVVHRRQRRDGKQLERRRPPRGLSLS